MALPNNDSMPSHEAISVIMPTYNQGAFIRRALASLFAQTYTNWELILINDGSTDYTEDVLEEYLLDNRVRYYKNDKNEGLGYCLNKGIEYAIYSYICYLPSDDIYYSSHLLTLYDCLLKSENAVLSYSGLYYENTDNYATGLSVKKANGIIPDRALQLVQIMHRRTTCRWVERQEFVTGNLDKMFWDKLRMEGPFASTNIISCEWVNHPQQRHKILSEKFGGGINFYKKYYSAEGPLRLYSDDGQYIDEGELFTQNIKIQLPPGKLKILLVGEASFNPDRLSVFEEQGHQLFGLWIPNPDFHNSVGPFSFGNITDLNRESFQSQIDEIKPDIIYALLNTQAVKLAHLIMITNPDIPFVWHFKEGPTFCRNMGIWNELVELYYNADGRIYINESCRNWFEQFIEDKDRPSFILDGDLPSSKYFSNTRSSLLSDTDGAIHTVMPGRPYGTSPQDIFTLSKYNVHVHLYGEFYHTRWNAWIDETQKLARGNLHLHKQCTPENWTLELSKYDAGWLHYFRSKNCGELLRCGWDDLNYPARMSTLAAAGLPMIMRNNRGNIVATQTLIESLNCGVLCNSIEDLGMQLNNKEDLDIKRQAIWKHRIQFSFDYYIKDLLTFFKEVIRVKHSQQLS